jgi:hypothetical protein
MSLRNRVTPPGIDSGTVRLVAQGLNHYANSDPHFESTICNIYAFLDADTLTEVFPCFFLICKANARVKLAKTEHGPHSPIVVLFCVLTDLYRSMYCLGVNVYCTAATG